MFLAAIWSIAWAEQGSAVRKHIIILSLVYHMKHICRFFVYFGLVALIGCWRLWQIRKVFEKYRRCSVNWKASSCKVSVLCNGRLKLGHLGIHQTTAWWVFPTWYPQSATRSYNSLWIGRGHHTSSAPQQTLAFWASNACAHLSADGGCNSFHIFFIGPHRYTLHRHAALWSLVVLNQST